MLKWLFVNPSHIQHNIRSSACAYMYMRVNSRNPEQCHMCMQSSWSNMNMTDDIQSYHQSKNNAECHIAPNISDSIHIVTCASLQMSGKILTTSMTARKTWHSDICDLVPIMLYRWISTKLCRRHKFIRKENHYWLVINSTQYFEEFHLLTTAITVCFIFSSVWLACRPSQLTIAMKLKP